MNLGNVATVRSGLVLSRKLSREQSPYCYPLLNLRAIHPEGYILSDDLEAFHAVEPLEQEYLTQQGDIIIRLSKTIIIQRHFSLGKLIQPKANTYECAFIRTLSQRQRCYK